MRLSSFSIKCVAGLIVMACSGAVAAVALGQLPQVPGDNDAQYVPVAKRPRSEVLAKGDGRYLRPDLTRGQLNDYRELLAWILNIKFTDAQCDSYEQRMITRWPSWYGLNTDEITGASKQIAEIKAMPPAQLKATHKSLHEQELKNLRDMIGGASTIGIYKVVTDEDRKDAAWLLGVYEEQHPEEVAPMPQMPNVPGAAAQPKPADPQPQQAPAAAGETPRGDAGPVDQTLASGATPLKKSATDAMCQVICFLAAKSRGGEYLPPGEAFQTLFARKIAAEYPTYQAAEQAAFAQIPQYWAQLHSSWDRMSAADQNQTLERWKPLLDALQTASAAASAPQQNLSADDRAALASMSDQEAQTRAQLEQLRAMQQRDLNQQMQLARMEQMQRMQAEQIRMMSNIAASAHETNMTIVHNMGPTRHPWD